MTGNPYAAPKAPVTDAQEERARKPGFGARFLWTLCCAFPVFAGLVLIYGARSVWLVGMLGSLMFAAAAGIIAVCIPVKNKAGFIIPSVVLALVVAYLIGSRSA